MSLEAISQAFQENNARVGVRIVGHAYLTRGDGTGTFIADQTLRMGFYWQQDESGQRIIGMATVDPGIVFENNKDYETIKVDLGYKPDDNKLYILGQNSYGMTSGGGTTIIEQKIAAAQQAVQLPLSVSADPAQPSMTVFINGWQPTVGGTAYQFPVSGTSLASYVPGGTAQMCYAVLFLDSDFSTLEVQTSTPRSQAAGLPLGLADRQQCITSASARANPIMAIPLFTGQTALTQADINTGVPMQNYISPQLPIGGTGSVTSVGLTMPNIFSVANSPVTNAGTFVVTLGSEGPNTVFAGGTAGSALPVFRPLVAADIPALSYVSNVGLTMPSIFNVANSPVTGIGTFAVTLGSEGPNTFFAGGTAGSAIPAFRSIVSADLTTALTTPPPIGGTTAAAGIFTAFTGNGTWTVTDAGTSTPTFETQGGSMEVRQDVYGANVPTLVWRHIPGTKASPTAITSGTFLGQISARGQYDTTVGHVTTDSGIAGFVSTEAFTSSANGTLFRVRLTPTGHDASTIFTALNMLPSGVTFVTKDDATNTSGSLAFSHRTFGTPAAGFGYDFSFQGDDDGNTNRTMALIRINWVSATSASRKGEMIFFAQDATAARQFMTGSTDGSNALLGFFGASAVVQQTQGATVTNNVTSGGTANTIANFTSLTTYATDAATIRNDIYQLTVLMKTVVDALRSYGLLT